MSSSFALLNVRKLCTDAVVARASGVISISKAKSKLKSEFHPDKALEIYTNVSGDSVSPVSIRYVQELMVRRLAKSRRFSDIESLIESYKRDPKITQEPFLSTLIRSYGLAGMSDHALKMYDQMDDLGTPRTPISFNSLLTAFMQSKLFDRVPQLFEEIPKKYKFSADKISYGILMKSYCQMGSLELAINKLKEMEDQGIEVSAITYSTILDALYKKGKSDEADRLWQEMIKKGCQPDVAAYNVRLMNAQGGHPEYLQELIEEMNNAGLKSDTISYNYLITCYCRNGKMDEAMNVYMGLSGLGCKPNATTFRTLVYHFCRLGMFERGYQVFNYSVEANKVPDFNTLKPLVEGLAKKDMKTKAKRLIGTLKKKFPPNFLNAWKKVEDKLGLSTGAPKERE